jgi:exosortase J
MSSLPTPDVTNSVAEPRGLDGLNLALISSSLAVFALLSILPTVFGLWLGWTRDGLNSIGMLVPIVSFVLVSRVWYRLDWKSEGSWWGLAILAATVALVRIREQAVILLVLSPKLSAPFPPPALVVFAFGSGVTLLIGGTRLYRAALFPIFLLWFVNPFPHTFSVLIDLPLQHVSAQLARGFAVALGQKLTPDNLRLMFTPAFGMFIAPGCNGIRGAVTMGLIALVAGYLYRFRWYVHAFIVAGAIILGYAFNLLRLYILVLYYLVALHLPWLQPRATMGDYVIGAVLFLVATLLLFFVIDRYSTANIESDEFGKKADKSIGSDDAVGIPTDTSLMQYLRLATLVTLGVYGLTGISRVYAEMRPDLIQLASPEVLPAHLGAYQRVRTWNETVSSGTVVYVWAQYAVPGGGPINLGISPILGPHDVMMCHSARGDDPLWRSNITMPTGGARPVQFNTAFFADGATQYLEASTLCTGSGCGEFATESTRFGIVFSRPDSATLLTAGLHRPIPVIIRTEPVVTMPPADTTRDQMTQAIRGFASGINFDELMQAYDR